MYSIQALWTAASHRLPIVFIILANAEYRILKHNLDIYRRRFDVATNHPYVQMDLVDPPLGFVEMAAGMGVTGTRVTEPDALAAGGPRCAGLRRAAPDRGRNRGQGLAPDSGGSW